MAYNAKLTLRVRDALSHLPKVEEKKMFSGVTFLVNGKMCINVGADRLMCRIDPAIHANAIQEEGCRTVIMKEREYQGWIWVDDTVVKTTKNFSRWVGLALEFNQRARAAKKRS